MGNKTFAEALKARTKKMAIETIKASRKISNDYAGQVVTKQLIRSSTSVAANYRAACRARSAAEFISKLGIVEEEADESCFWIELLMESELCSKQEFEAVYKEVKEITAIVTASGNTAKQRFKR